MPGARPRGHGAIQGDARVVKRSRIERSPPGTPWGSWGEPYGRAARKHAGKGVDRRKVGVFTQSARGAEERPEEWFSIEDASTKGSSVPDSHKRSHANLPRATNLALHEGEMAVRRSKLETNMNQFDHKRSRRPRITGRLCDLGQYPRRHPKDSSSSSVSHFSPRCCPAWPSGPPLAQGARLDGRGSRGALRGRARARAARGSGANEPVTGDARQHRARPRNRRHLSFQEGLSVVVIAGTEPRRSGRE